MNKKTITLSISVIAICTLIAVTFYARKQVPNSNGTEPLQSQNDKLPPLNLDPPTQGELDQTADFKDDFIADEENRKDGDGDGAIESSSQSSVKPVITRFDQQDTTVYVRAFVQSDNGGTCTLKMTKGNSSFTLTSDTEIQPSYYQCSGFTFDKSELPSLGAWSAVVEFENSSQKGSSDEETYTIS